MKDFSIQNKVFGLTLDLSKFLFLSYRIMVIQFFRSLEQILLNFLSILIKFSQLGRTQILWTPIGARVFAHNLWSLPLLIFEYIFFDFVMSLKVIIRWLGLTHLLRVLNFLAQKLKRLLQNLAHLLQLSWSHRILAVRLITLLCASMYWRGSLLCFIGIDRIFDLQPLLI